MMFDTETVEVVVREGEDRGRYFTVDTLIITDADGEERNFCLTPSLDNLSDEDVELILDVHQWIVLREYPRPLDAIASQLVASNRAVVDERPDTVGAHNILKHGLSANQYDFVEEVRERMERADELEEEMRLVEKYGGPQRELAHFAGDDE